MALKRVFRRSISGKNYSYRHIILYMYTYRRARPGRQVQDHSIVFSAASTIGTFRPCLLSISTLPYTTNINANCIQHTHLNNVTTRQRCQCTPRHHDPTIQHNAFISAPACLLCSFMQSFDPDSATSGNITTYACFSREV